MGRYASSSAPGPAFAGGQAPSFSGTTSVSTGIPTMTRLGQQNPSPLGQVQPPVPGLANAAGVQAAMAKAGFQMPAIKARTPDFKDDPGGVAIRRWFDRVDDPTERSGMGWEPPGDGPDMNAADPAWQAALAKFKADQNQQLPPELADWAAAQQQPTWGTTAARAGIAGVLGGAAGAAAGLFPGMVAGHHRGNTMDGMDRGMVRGGFTGMGAGVGSMLGARVGESAGHPGYGALAGAGLGGLAGWMGSGKLLGPPEIGPSEPDQEDEVVNLSGLGIGGVVGARMGHRVGDAVGHPGYGALVGAGLGGMTGWLGGRAIDKMFAGHGHAHSHHETEKESAVSAAPRPVPLTSSSSSTFKPKMPNSVSGSATSFLPGAGTGKTLGKLASQDNRAPRLSATGEGKGLKFTDAGPQVYGKDAWNLKQWTRQGVSEAPGARFEEKTAGLASAAWKLARNPKVMQTAGGALGGLGLTAAELGTGAADPNMSMAGKGGLALANMAGGAALGNPAIRRGMFFQRSVKPLATGGLAPAYSQGINFRWPRAAAATGLAAYAPTAASGLDGVSRVSGKLTDTLTNHPENMRPLLDPAGYGKELVTHAGSTPAVTEASKEFARTFGAGAAGLTGGSLAGYLAGGGVGNMLAPDDETLDYESRRNRERMRGGLSFLGTTGGAVGGMLLGQHLASKSSADLSSFASGFIESCRAANLSVSQIVKAAQAAIEFAPEIRAELEAIVKGADCGADTMTHATPAVSTIDMGEGGAAGGLGGPLKMPAAPVMPAPALTKAAAPIGAIMSGLGKGFSAAKSFAAPAFNAVKSYAAPVAKTTFNAGIGAATGYEATGDWKGGLAGGLAGGVAGSPMGARSPGLQRFVQAPLRMGAGGGLLGFAGDQALGMAGHDTGGAGAKWGTRAGLGLGLGGAFSPRVAALGDTVSKWATPAAIGVPSVGLAYQGGRIATQAGQNALASRMSPMIGQGFEQYVQSPQGQQFLNSQVDKQLGEFGVTRDQLKTIGSWAGSLQDGGSSILGPISGIFDQLASALSGGHPQVKQWLASLSPLQKAMMLGGGATALGGFATGHNGIGGLGALLAAGGAFGGQLLPGAATQAAAQHAQPEAAPNALAAEQAAPANPAPAEPAPAEPAPAEPAPANPAPANPAPANPAPQPVFRYAPGITASLGAVFPHVKMPDQAPAPPPAIPPVTYNQGPSAAGSDARTQGGFGPVTGPSLSQDPAGMMTA